MQYYFQYLFQILILFVGLNLLFSCESFKGGKDKTQSDADTTALMPIMKFGIPADSFLLITGIVENNQYLGQILSRNGVGMADIDRIAKKSRSVFDARKIRSGNNFTFFLTPDTLKQARYFVYENSPTEYFVYELFDTLNVYRGEKPIETRLRTASGEVRSSLWNAMKDNNLDPIMAIELDEIYQWTIDFFAIQKGDRFRVIYEEQFVDSTSIGIGKIFAVQFDHAGSENYAFLFDQDKRLDYFDDQGVSLRKAFLKAPLKFSRISSHFSNSRLHPVLRIRRPHHGIDYAAPKGTPVVSIGDGTVIAKSYQASGGGNYVKIKHNSVYTTTYMHLSGFGPGIVSGARVKQGQIIGFVGSTGLSTGPHLDFRVHRNGAPINPLKVESPPVEPVKPENMLRYTHLKDSLINELKNIGWDGQAIFAGN